MWNAFPTVFNALLKKSVQLVISDFICNLQAVYHAKFSIVNLALLHHLLAILALKDIFTTVLKSNVYLAQSLVKHASQLIFLNVLDALEDIMRQLLKVRQDVHNVSVTVLHVQMQHIARNVPSGTHCQSIPQNVRFLVPLNALLVTRPIRQNALLATLEVRSIPQHQHASQLLQSVTLQNPVQPVLQLTSFIKINVSNVHILKQTALPVLLALLIHVPCAHMVTICNQVNVKNVKQTVRIVWVKVSVSNALMAYGWIKSMTVQQVFAKHVTLFARLVQTVHYFVLHVMIITL